jgi:hypothetical protein
MQGQTVALVGRRVWRWGILHRARRSRLELGFPLVQRAPQHVDKVVGDLRRDPVLETDRPMYLDSLEGCAAFVTDGHGAVSVIRRSSGQCLLAHHERMRLAFGLVRA